MFDKKTFLNYLLQEPNGEVDSLDMFTDLCFV